MAKTKRFQRVAVLIIGILMVLAVIAAVALFAIQGRAAKKAETAAKKLYEVIPEPQAGFPDDRLNMDMPIFELDGQDFIAIIEIPAYGTCLPVQGGWSSSKLLFSPCLYKGSMYDDTLIIGGSDAQGQFDFMKLITGGDVVYVTDMTGLRYTYTVTDIEKMKDVSVESLTAKEAELVLFAKNTYSFGYTVVRCKIGY